MNRLKELRLKKGLTIKELAEKIGIDKSSLSLMETGKRPLNPRTLKKFCEFYKVKPNELLGYDTMIEIDESTNEFSEEDIKVLRSIKALPQEDYDLLVEYVSYLIWRHQKRIDDYYDKERHKN